MKQHSAEFQEKLEGVSFPPALPAKKYVSKYIYRYIYQTMQEKTIEINKYMTSERKSRVVALGLQYQLINRYF